MKVFIFIIIMHWIADFIFQAENWALGKSKSLTPLLKHTITYSLLWIIPVYFMTQDVYIVMYNWMSLFLFVGITFVVHTITDFFTSKIVSKRFADNYYGSPIPNLGAFSIIGFDQVLHYVQLILTWYFVFGIRI